MTGKMHTRTVTHLSLCDVFRGTISFIAEPIEDVLDLSICQTARVGGDVALQRFFHERCLLSFLCHMRLETLEGDAKITVPHCNRVQKAWLRERSLLNLRMVAQNSIYVCFGRGFSVVQIRKRLRELRFAEQALTDGA